MPTRGLLDREEEFVFHFRTFQGLKASLSAVFGTASNSIMFEGGIEAGRQSCRRRMDVAKDKEDALKLLVEAKTSENWGDLAFDNVDWKRGSGRIFLANSFEAKGAISKEPSCYLFKGYLVGFLSELLKSQVALSEDACMATGASRCEFTFRSVSGGR